MLYCVMKEFTHALLGFIHLFHKGLTFPRPVTSYKNRYTVVDVYVSPGFSKVEGKAGWFGESG